MDENESKTKKTRIAEVLPKAGLLYSERGTLHEVLCKPKILPIKSLTLQKMEELEKKMTQKNDNDA